MATPEDEIWEWADEGTADKRSDRGRIYYKRVSVRRRTSSRRRYFSVGDPVVMSGDDGEVWIAQIVNLFQAQENDIHIKELMRNSTARNGDERRYELMRCTLRWFYTISDMNHHTLNTSRVPKPIPDEIWFSDHVEQDGFNDVQVIEGKAWLFPAVQAKHAFSKDPDPSYDKRKDKLRIVRCFVDSTSDHLPVRELERGELERLLRHPTTDKDLFANSRLRLFGSTGAVLKGTGKKKRRHTTIRSPVNVDEDEFLPCPPEKKSRLHGVEAKVELGLKGTSETERTKGKHRRRKIVENDDDDENGGFAKRRDNRDHAMDDDDEPLASRLQTLDQQQRADARRLDLENREVVAWVSELNDNAYNGDLQDKPRPSDSTAKASKPSTAIRVNEHAAVEKPGSRHRRGDISGTLPKDHKTKRRETETIIIDDDGDADVTFGRKPQRPKMPIPPRSDKQQGNNRQVRYPGPSKSTFTGKPFMPTQRSRKPPSATGSKSTPSLSTSRTGTAVPQKRASEPGAIRHSQEKTSHFSKKQSEKAQVRKGLPQPSTRQERTSRQHGRPGDREFLADITTAMERMKLDLAKMPTESKSLMKGRIEWLVGAVIDKMFDGRKERAHDVGDIEARKIVDSTLTELQGIYSPGLKGSRSTDESRSGAVQA